MNPSTSGALVQVGLLLTHRAVPYFVLTFTTTGYGMRSTSELIIVFFQLFQLLIIQYIYCMSVYTGVRREHVCLPGVRAWCGGSGSDMYKYNMVWRDHLVMHAYMLL